jgi:hypothetical protein
MHASKKSCGSASTVRPPLKANVISMEFLNRLDHADADAGRCQTDLKLIKTLECDCKSAVLRVARANRLFLRFLTLKKLCN